MRLCKAKRFRYKHNDMADLKAKLEEAKGCRFKMIFTDSVFSMDGDLAKLPEICELADQYDAIVGIDDCHGTGHLGAGGRGAAEELGVLDRIDVITSTLGKTLGGGGRRLHGGAGRGRGLAEEPVAAVPVLEFGPAVAGRRGAEGPGRDRPQRRPARPAQGEHEANAGRAGGPRASRSSPGRRRFCRSCSATPPWPRRWPTSFSGTAST